MKIYTKTGDKGGTSLLGGERVNKDDARIEAYGTVDELNSHIGLLSAFVEHEELDKTLHKVQAKLFDIGSHLASNDPKHPSLPPLEDSIVKDLEYAIDSMEAELTPLKTFILPGGSKSSSQCHICRTVCRRAERRVVTLNQQEKRYNLIVQILNRLSDYLFVLSRWICQLEGAKEIAWLPSKS